MNQLRDAIADAFKASGELCIEGADPRNNNGQTFWQDDADAILAMPEMQAIKLALQNVAEDDRYAFGGITDATQALTDRGLPGSVIGWVLS